MLVWTFHTLQSDSQDLLKVNSTLKFTRNTSWVFTSPNTWTLLKKKMKKNSRNTSLNTSRYFLSIWPHIGSLISLSGRYWLRRHWSYVLQVPCRYPCWSSCQAKGKEGSRQEEMEQSQNLLRSKECDKFFFLFYLKAMRTRQRKCRISTFITRIDKTVSHKSKLHSFVPKPPRRNKCSDLFCYLPVRSFYSSVQWGYKKRGTKSLWSSGWISLHRIPVRPT